MIQNATISQKGEMLPDNNSVSSDCTLFCNIRFRDVTIAMFWNVTSVVSLQSLKSLN